MLAKSYVLKTMSDGKIKYNITNKNSRQGDVKNKSFVMRESRSNTFLIDISDDATDKMEQFDTNNNS